MTPIVALLYDFDKTLCTTDMEDYAFIPALGYTPAEFWKKANDFGRENRMDGLLAYMYTMIAECRAQNIRLDREFRTERSRGEACRGQPRGLLLYPQGSHRARRRARNPGVSSG